MTAAKAASRLGRVEPASSKSEKERLAPPRRGNHSERAPARLILPATVRSSATLLLVHEGREIGRIVGYTEAATVAGPWSRLIKEFRKTTGEAPSGALRSGRSG